MTQFETCDKNDLHKFLVETKGFSENKVENGIKRLLKAQTKPVQNRLNNFFSKSP